MAGRVAAAGGDARETTADGGGAPPRQQLGDCLGKGAFGSVYRALNWGTGETVAVKKVKLADLPKSDLRVIMVSGGGRGGFDDRGSG